VSAVAASSALEVIRAATADAHRALEQKLEIARPNAGEDAYGRYLEAMLGWLAPLEPALWAGAWPVRVAAAERADKVRWIEADLQARGRTAQLLAALPRQRVLPPLDSLAQRFGVAYVIEGAQLGGQMLLRTLGPRLSPLPTRWLQGYGPQSGERWRTFLAALDTNIADPRTAESAAESARLSFELLHAWFAQRGIA
jgi:heme oxygenase (biliverdin-IX-beta and delta-forming)